MLGKLLLLALVCVAANSQVVEENLSTTIQAGLNETKTIHNRIFLTTNSALDVYYDSDLEIFVTVREQFEKFEALVEKEAETVADFSEKLIELATQAQASEAVFACISTRTVKTVQSINDAVSDFDKTNTQTGETKRQELFRLTYRLFQIRASLLYEDSFFNTTEEIRSCTTPECVWEVVNRYGQENDGLSAEIRQTVPKLLLNLEKAKRGIKSTWIIAKSNLNKAKGAGMRAMKACLNIKA